MIFKNVTTSSDRELNQRTTERIKHNSVFFTDSDEEFSINIKLEYSPNKEQ